MEVGPVDLRRRVGRGKKKEGEGKWERMEKWRRQWRDPSLFHSVFRLWRKRQHNRLHHVACWKLTIFFNELLGRTVEIIITVTVYFLNL